MTQSNSCHTDPTSELPLVSEHQKAFVALVGAPNSGKTTLYNQITNSSFRTVNYPGATVEYAVGKTRAEWGEEFFVFDTPGTYSLFPKSMDEEVTRKVLYELPEWGHAHTVICVVDATQISRHLYIYRQLKESGFNLVVALTMVDLMNERQQFIDLNRMSTELGCPVVAVNGLKGDGVQELVNTVRKNLATKSAAPTALAAWTPEKIKSEMILLGKVGERILCSKGGSAKKRDIAETTKAIDKFLLHPFWGILIFFCVMSAIFSSIFWVAAPLMDGIDSLFAYLVDLVASVAPTSLWVDFLANGLIASVGTVLIFVPQIFILFLGITLLEESGYLARAASLIDRPLQKIGLNGRAFVPILSGYACAIPAMMAARTIPSRKERFLALFILPLTSCSARLPVYALFLAFLFRDAPAWQPGLILALIYFVSLVFTAGAAWISNFFLRHSDKSFFILELPFYRRPHLRSLFKTVTSRTSGYLTKAAPVIFIFAVIMWAGTTFPQYNAESKSDRLTHSYAAQAGKWIEPVMEPMGGDWRTGVGLISAFAAREVFVASLAMAMHVTESDDEGEQEAGLLEKMSQAKTQSGEPLFTVASVCGLILFFMIALQCMATFALARREFGSWTMPVVQLVVFNLVAYGLAVGAVQGLRAMGIQ